MVGTINKIIEGELLAGVSSDPSTRMELAKGALKAALQVSPMQRRKTANLVAARASRCLA